MRRFCYTYVHTYMRTQADRSPRCFAYARGRRSLRTLGLNQHKGNSKKCMSIVRLILGKATKYCLTKLKTVNSNRCKMYTSHILQDLIRLEIRYYRHRNTHCIWTALKTPLSLSNLYQVNVFVETIWEPYATAR